MTDFFDDKFHAKYDWPKDQNNTFWTNPFLNSDFESEPKYGMIERECELKYNITELSQPSPQRRSIDFTPNFYENEVKFDDHYLDQVVSEMVDNGELDAFLSENTVCLKEIQDDISIRYGTTPKARTAQTQRRHSVGSTTDLIQCPFPDCDKIFNRTYNFKSHLKTHCNDRPFKCDHCDQSFARCHDLKRHANIHNKNSKEVSKCDICKKSFSRPDSLSRHMRMNTCHPSLFKGLLN